MFGSEKKPKPPKPLCAHQRLALENAQKEDAAALPDSTEKCLECKAASKAALNYRLKLICGLLMPFALQALDVTM